MYRLLFGTDPVLDPTQFKHLRGGRASDGVQSIHEIATELSAHGFTVDATHLHRLADHLLQRCRLSVCYHAIVVAYLRPFEQTQGWIKKTVLRPVRGLYDDVCAPSGVRLNCAPIILIDVNAVLYRQPREGASFTAGSIPWTYIAEPGHAFKTVLEDALADWMRSLLLELDYVGYSLVFNDDGTITVAHALRRSRRRASRMFSSESTPRSLRQSGYLLVHQDLFESFAPYRQLEYVLNHVRHLKPAEQEYRLQQCFETHPVLVRRGLFERHWSRPQLKHPNPLKGTIIPDFVLGPVESAGAEGWEVVEIKSSERSLLERGTPSAFVVRALEQLRLRYGSYFEDLETVPEQRRVLQQVLEHPRYALIIGRRPMDDEARRIEEFTANSPWNDVGIIQYDDILDAGRRDFYAAQRILRRGSDL